MSINKKGPGYILGDLFGGKRPLLGGGSLQGLEGLRKDIETTGKRAGAIYKRQRIIDVKMDAIIQELGIKVKEQQITVDYGQDEIDKLTKLIEEMENDGDDVGLLTKISALRNLQSLLSKMTKNVGLTLKKVTRTELRLEYMIQYLQRKKEDAKVSQASLRGEGNSKS